MESSKSMISQLGREDPGNVGTTLKAISLSKNKKLLMVGGRDGNNSLKLFKCSSTSA